MVWWANWKKNLKWHLKKVRNGGRTTTRSTSSTSMRSRPQRRSSSGSGLSTTSSTMSNGHQSIGGRGSHSNDLMGRASSASSLSSFDDRYDHLYSYSSNLDLFEHQLFKTAQHRSKVSSQQNPSNKTEAVNDTFDLTAETRLLMDRTSQLVGKKSDREWVIWLIQLCTATWEKNSEKKNQEWKKFLSCGREWFWELNFLGVAIWPFFDLSFHATLLTQNVKSHKETQSVMYQLTVSSQNRIYLPWSTLPITSKD